MGFGFFEFCELSLVPRNKFQWEPKNCKIKHGKNLPPSLQRLQLRPRTVNKGWGLLADDEKLLLTPLITVNTGVQAILSSVQFLTRRMCVTASQVNDHFLDSCDLNVWIKSDIIRRN